MKLGTVCKGTPGGADFSSVAFKTEATSKETNGWCSTPSPVLWAGEGWNLMPVWTVWVGTKTIQGKHCHFPLICKLQLFMLDCRAEAKEAPILTCSYREEADSERDAPTCGVCCKLGIAVTMHPSLAIPHVEVSAYVCMRVHARTQIWAYISVCFSVSVFHVDIFSGFFFLNVVLESPRLQVPLVFQLLSTCNMINENKGRITVGSFKKRKRKRRGGESPLEPLGSVQLKLSYIKQTPPNDWILSFTVIWVLFFALVLVGGCGDHAKLITWDMNL